MVIWTEKERGGEREREREREKERESKREKVRKRERGRLTDRHTDKKNKEALEIEVHREKNVTESQKYRKTNTYSVRERENGEK